MAAKRTKLSLGLKGKLKRGGPRKLGTGGFASQIVTQPSLPAPAQHAVASRGRSSAGGVSIVRQRADSLDEPQAADLAASSAAPPPEASGANATPVGDEPSQSSGRQIDRLLQELKGRQSRGEHISSAKGRAGKEGKVPRGDPTTTNIFVSNLPPITTEEELREAFEGFGPLVSVKVMWPRTDEEAARGSNPAFVAYHRRPDAEKAMLTMQGAKFGPAVTGLRLQWSRAVKGAMGDAMPSPTPDMTDTHARGVRVRSVSMSESSPPPVSGATRPSSSPEQSRLTSSSSDYKSSSSPSVAAIQSSLKSPIARVVSASAESSSMPQQPPHPSLTMPSPPMNAKVFQVRFPSARWRRRVIDRWAWYVARDGARLEQELIDRVRGTSSSNSSGTASMDAIGSLAMHDTRLLVPGLASRAQRGFDWSWLQSEDVMTRLTRGENTLSEGDRDALYYRWRVWQTCNALTADSKQLAKSMAASASSSSSSCSCSSSAAAVAGTEVALVNESAAKKLSSRVLMRDWDDAKPLQMVLQGVWLLPPRCPHRHKVATISRSDVVTADTDISGASQDAQYTNLEVPVLTPPARAVSEWPLPAGVPLAELTGLPLRRCFLENRGLFRGRWKGWASQEAVSRIQATELQDHCWLSHAVADLKACSSDGSFMEARFDALALAESIDGWAERPAEHTASLTADTVAELDGDDGDSIEDDDDSLAVDDAGSVGSAGTWTDSDEEDVPGRGAATLRGAAGGNTGLRQGVASSSSSSSSASSAGTISVLSKRAWSQLPADPITNPAQLPWRQFQQWCCMLRDMKPSVFHVRQAAVWAMDHAEDAAEEVAAILADSICTPAEATPLTCRISRLYVVSDILINGVLAETPDARSAANRLRNCLILDLPRIFECLGEAMACVPHRMRRGAAMERLSGVLSAWSKRAAMLPSVLAGFEAALTAPNCIAMTTVSQLDTPGAADLTHPSRSEAAAFGVWLEEDSSAGLERTRQRITHAHQCDDQRKSGGFRLDAPMPALQGAVRASDCVAVATRMRRLELVHASRVSRSRLRRAETASQTKAASSATNPGKESSPPRSTGHTSAVAAATWEAVG